MSRGGAARLMWMTSVVRFLSTFDAHICGLDPKVHPQGGGHGFPAS
ncbi:MAG: hypothetical protein INR66_09435 [Gordonia polyisoprenivorans]|nr:hypothetical protein [Gordonia polyisoprenivorans]